MQNQYLSRARQPGIPRSVCSSCDRLGTEPAYGAWLLCCKASLAEASSAVVETNLAQASRLPLMHAPKSEARMASELTTRLTCDWLGRCAGRIV